jgi:hypothetical protein
MTTILPENCYEIATSLLLLQNYTSQLACLAV